MVERVAFDRFAAGFRDQAFDLVDGEDLGCFGAGVVIDQFMPHGAVQVVGAVGERGLRRADAEHDPVGLDVIDVVEHQPADGHGAQVHHARRLADVAQPGVIRMKGQRNKRLKPAGLVLQLAEPDQMIDAVERILNVAV